MTNLAEMHFSNAEYLLWRWGSVREGGDCVLELCAVLSFVSFLLELSYISDTLLLFPV